MAFYPHQCSAWRCRSSWQEKTYDTMTSHGSAVSSYIQSTSILHAAGCVYIFQWKYERTDGQTDGQAKIKLARHAQIDRLSEQSQANFFEAKLNLAPCSLF